MDPEGSWRLLGQAFWDFEGGRFVMTCAPGGRIGSLFGYGTFSVPWDEPRSISIAFVDP